jgi:hypothetical protein
MKTRKYRSKNKKKLIVFDLDETIGHFEEFGRFIDGLGYFHEHEWFAKSLKENAFEKITEKYFDVLIDLYPEFFRYGIFQIFKSLLNKKKKNKHLKVAIYTNNMGPRSWTMYIKKYIENKLESKIFDKVITGFHTNTKKCRTTYNKTHEDLIECGNFPKNTQILFFDDQFHKNMLHDNIKYIQLHPYRMSISFDEMSKRFLKKKEELGEEFEFSPASDEKKFKTIMHNILSKMGEKYPTYRIRKLHVSKVDILEFKRINKNIKKFTKGTKKKKKTKKH